MMVSFNRTRCRATAILFLVVAFAVRSSLGTSLRSRQLAQKERKTSTPTRANLVNKQTEDSIGSEKEQDGTFRAEDLFTPITERNVSRSADGTSLSPSRAEPEYHLQQEISTRRPIIKESASRETPYRKTNRTTLSTLAPVFDEAEPGKSIRSEKEKDGYKFHAEDLLMPIPQSVSLLSQLMNLSMQNMDTAFRGTSKNQQSPIAQHVQSFRTTLLQLIQKLSNAFSISRTNADEIKMRIVYGPSKVNETIQYLKELENSNSTLLFGVLHSSTMHLKEITDQTFNLSSQISNHFEELVQLVDEVIKSHNLSMSNKERQVRNTTAELHRENEEKKRTQTEIFLKEKEIENLKEQRQSDESAFHYALENLKQLQSKETDESQCYWKYNWDRNRTYTWICPHHPDPSQIRQANQTAKTAQKNLEKTMKLLYAKEEEAAKKKLVDNELKIRIERLNHEKNQLNKDVQLLRNTSDLLSRLAKSQETLDKNWKKFVAICGKLQSGVTKSLDVFKEASRTVSTHWNNQLSEGILLNLNKTNEDLSLVKSVIDIYLEGSNQELFMKMIIEVTVGFLMTNSNFLDKCHVASREIN